MNSQPSQSPPKYVQVFNKLRKDIESGRYEVGEKIPSEAALVKQLGTSRITIGRALRELGRQNFIERRAGSGSYVRAPRTNGLTFGLIIPNTGPSDVLAPICQGMADAAQQGRHALLGGHAPETSDPCFQAWQLCLHNIERQVAGVFFSPLDLSSAGDAMNRQIIAALADAGVPVVLLDRCYLPHPQRSNLDLVGIDNRRAGYLAIEHLWSAGSRKPAFIAWPDAAPTIDARIAGFREALLTHTPLPAPILRIDSADPDSVRAIMDKHRPDSFVCANDRTAGSLMHSLLALGYPIPREIRIVGTDDAGYASLLPVPLTTVRQPCREIGIAAIHTMLERLANPAMPARDILLAATLTVRQSA